MDDEDEEFLATILFRFELTDPKVPEVEMEITLPELWLIYKAFQCGGLQEVRSVVLFAGNILTVLQDKQVADIDAAFDEVWNAFGGTFDLHDKRWTSGNDLTLSFCYFLLREQLINRTEATELGHILLDLNESITPTDVEAFRKRVDRWAIRNNLPHPGQPRRRTPTA